MNLLYEQDIINVIGKILLQNSQTVSVAESVTSGHLQAAFSTAKNAAGFFQGGLTAYNIGQKTKQLNVEPTCAIQTNCISKIVAREMALHIAEKFLSTFGISATGYAAPESEQNVEKPFAYYCITKDGKVLEENKIEYDKKKFGIHAQIFYTNTILQKLLRLIKM